jgi:hypothetical protein
LDGQTQRKICTVTALRTHCSNANQDDWDDYLDMFDLRFSCAVKASTQRSLYKSLCGQKPQLSINAVFVAIASRNPTAIDRASGATESSNEIESVSRELSSARYATPIDAMRPSGSTKRFFCRPRAFSRLKTFSLATRCRSRPRASLDRSW